MKFQVNSKLKKYKDINGYTFNSDNSGSAYGHVLHRLNNKFSQYEIDQAIRKGKLRIVAIGI